MVMFLFSNEKMSRMFHCQNIICALVVYQKKILLIIQLLFQMAGAVVLCHVYSAMDANLFFCMPFMSDADMELFGW